MLFYWGGAGRQGLGQMIIRLAVDHQLDPTTSFLTAATSQYTIGDGITAGTRLSLQLKLVKGFKEYSLLEPILYLRIGSPRPPVFTCHLTGRAPELLDPNPNPNPHGSKPSSIFLI